MKIYRHYFKDKESKFSYCDIKPIKNLEIPWNKPYGGFWASAIDSKYGWKEWCENEGFVCHVDNYFDFTLKDNAKILYLKTLDDIFNILKFYPMFLIQCYQNQALFKYFREQEKYNKDDLIGNIMAPECILNFEKLVKYGYDAIEVEIDELYYILYGWDCDSILVLNPNAIIPIGD